LSFESLMLYLGVVHWTHCSRRICHNRRQVPAGKPAVCEKAASLFSNQLVPCEQSLLMKTNVDSHEESV